MKNRDVAASPQLVFHAIMRSFDWPCRK